MPKEERESIRGSQKSLLINAGSWAKNLGVAQIILQKSEGQEKWQVISKNGWLEPVKNIPAATDLLQLSAPYHKKTLAYIRTEVATLTDTLSSEGGRFADNPVVELINRAQMDYTGADISFAASFNDHFKIAPGSIRIKDIYGMYRYENFLDMIEMSGRQIKDFLTYSAQYYQWDNGAIAANPQMAGYNYDMAEGLRYKIYVNRNSGTNKQQAANEVRDLIFIKTGKPLEMNRIYKVAMNSYRATGGGGHMAAANALSAKVIFKSDTEMRNILSAYFKKIKTIRPTVDHNWQIVSGR